jgi:uncharacterized protein Smg (DUF494 family)
MAHDRTSPDRNQTRIRISAFPMASMTFRVLGPHERGRFSPEAWGHLLGLAGSGVVSAGELEHIIERALLQIDGPIALDDLKAFMEAAGLFVRAVSDPNQQTIH